ncbi:MAG: hypothetical protein ACOY3E_06615 [Pseudomonadota bacterium]
MNSTLRNSLAFLAAVILGMVVNGGLISISAQVIPPPAGVDVTQAESLAANIHRFEPKHFLMPFLAHALGTLAGAIAVTLLAASQQKKLALAVGALFLTGGVMAAFMIPAPVWFIGLDLLAAYLPMALLGFVLAKRLKPAVR